MTDSEYLQQIHPKARSAALKAYVQCKSALTGRAKPAITFALRTIEEQDKLYAQGRTAPGQIVTNAKGGQSYHNYGLALDIALLIDGKTLSWDTAKDWDGDRQSDWMECVSIFKKNGFEWGGDWRTFKDMPHFEMRFGHTWQELLALVHAGKVDSNGYVIL